MFSDDYDDFNVFAAVVAEIENFDEEDFSYIDDMNIQFGETVSTTVH